MFANGAVTAAFARAFNEELGAAKAKQRLTAEEQRARIAEVATSMEGDESYSVDSKKGRFGPGTWKCNLFVHDVLLDAGIQPPRTEGGWPILANSWANPDLRIPGWEVVSDPLPGDVAAIPRSGDSGHVGIYIGDNWGSDVMAANRNGVGWSASHHRNEWFNWAANASGDTVYRRWVGDSRR
jgi:cell wall-associated NlpC family hydrolase